MKPEGLLKSERPTNYKILPFNEDKYKKNLDYLKNKPPDKQKIVGYFNSVDFAVTCPSGQRAVKESVQRLEEMGYKVKEI